MNWKIFKMMGRNGISFLLAHEYTIWERIVANATERSKPENALCLLLIFKHDLLQLT